MNETNIQTFGYTEMYEWKETPEHKDRLGRFMTFDKSEKSKVKFAKDSDYIIGVSSVCAIETSDDPDEWKYAYLCNEYGDLYLQKERLAVGAKQYDQMMEMNYIRTYPWEHFVRIPNKYFDENQQYVKRSNRPEWVRVTLVGKAIVKDNGKCKPGTFCSPYNGKIKDLHGTAVESGKYSKNKFYVIDRLSENTILVLIK